MTGYEWFDADQCVPPHSVTSPAHADMLLSAFRDGGWKAGYPALVGYNGLHTDGRIQLASGSHRWAAAALAGIKIPVAVKPYADVYEMFGTDKWIEWIQNPPVVKP